MKFSPELVTRTAFAALLAILTVITALAYRSTDRLLINADATREAHEARSAALQILAGIGVIEIAQGRFLMTGDDRMLAAFETEVPRIATLLKRIRESTAAREHLSELAQLEELLKHRIALAQELIALRRTRHVDAAIARISSGETTALQMGIRAAADKVAALQEARIVQLDTDAAATANATVHMLLVGSLPAVTSAFLAFFFAGSRLAARKLAAREQRLELAMRAARLGIWDWDLRSGKIVWSGVHEKLWGLPRGAFRGDYAQFEERVHPDDRAHLRTAIERALKTRTEYNCEYRIVLPDGSVHWMAGRGHGMYENDAAVRMSGVVSDITERRVAEAAREHAQALLAASEARLRNILDNEPECVKLLAPDGTLLDMNPAGLRMVEADSLEQVAGQCIYGLVAEADRERFRQLTERVFRGDTGSLEFEAIGLKGTRRWLETHVSPLRDAKGAIIALLSVTRDMTARKRAEAERQRLESQLAHAQKMEALGRLAGGVAHDFNNILSAIIGNAELARQDSTAAQAAQRSLDEIVKAGQRAKHLVRQILTFSRKQPLERRPLRLDSIVAECATLLRATLPPTVQLNAHCGADAPPVMADATQMHQVMLNLATNAWHALPHNTGVIEIRCERAVVTTPLPAHDAMLSAGTYACLSVHDTGIGMSRDELIRIFEPFYTTKPIGHGSGLGLAVVDGIVKNHDGKVRVESAPDAGSTFYLYFPAFDGIVTDSPSPTPAAQTVGNGETILYVDDDDAIVFLAVRLLERSGFKVVAYSQP